MSVSTKVRTEPRTAGVLHLVPLSRLKMAPFNPPTRVEANRLRRLRASIEDIGLIYPVVIDKHNNVVDGHRRCAVARQLGWRSIPALAIDAEFEHAYGSIQLNQEKLNGLDLLGVYLKNPGALLGIQRSKLSRIEETCGRDTLKLLDRTRTRPGVFDLAVRLDKYTSGKIGIKAAIVWMIRHGMQMLVRHVLQNNLDPEVVVKAVKNDKPIKIKLSHDE